jgi:hypothetical protein
MNVLSDCLSALEREQVGSTCPIVDHEVVRSAVADEATVWLICRNRSDQRTFSDTELARSRSGLRQRLLRAGVDESIVDGLDIRVTSREEVEQRGGFAALR